MRSPSPVGPAGEHASVGSETGHDVARPKTFDERKGGALVKPVYFFEKDPVNLGMSLFGNEKLVREGTEFSARLVTFDTRRGVYFPMWKNNGGTRSGTFWRSISILLLDSGSGAWDPVRRSKRNTCYPRGFPESHPGGGA